MALKLSAVAGVGSVIPVDYAWRRPERNKKGLACLWHVPDMEWCRGIPWSCDAVAMSAGMTRI